MSADDNLAEQWRKLAAEARAIAAMTPNSDAKRIMLFIAEGYRSLAERAEARKNQKQ